MQRKIKHLTQTMFQFTYPHNLFEFWQARKIKELTIAFTYASTKADTGNCWQRASCCKNKIFLKARNQTF